MHANGSRLIARLPAGGHCTINVAFNPAVKGTARATLSVSTGTAASTQAVVLSGSGF
ncbi:MAG TPA: hypothetical protein VIH50_07730 [Steroidobacteraceae bacterium]